ncbi:hypothetical protein ACMD2_11518, partial [Ananas comosus]
CVPTLRNSRTGYIRYYPRF